MTKFGIGQAVPRLEDRRLLTGGGRYTDDMALDGLTHGYVLRSPHAHARIAAIDVSRALAAPGVVAVLTNEDVAADGLGDLPCQVPTENRDGSAGAPTPRPLLARERVRHVGEPVAFVVAESLNQAKDAAELIVVDYEDLPTVVDTFAAAQTGAPQIWDHIPGNVCFDWEMGDEAAVEAAFAAAPRTTKVRLVNNRLVVASMEPRGAVAMHDVATGRTTLHTGTQGPHFVIEPLAADVLKLDQSALRVTTGDVGGGFGMKAFVDAELSLTTWAARKLDRPVKWTCDRSEAFLSDAQGRDHVSIAEAAMDEEGHILAVRVTTYAAMGAYLTPFAPFVPTTGSTHMVAGLYKAAAIHVNVKGMITNTVPVGPYRGAGRPEAAYLIERLIDVAGRELGLSQDEIRRRNFIQADEIPYTTALGYVYDSGDFPTLMAECMARADWAGFEARRAEAEARGKLRGIGMGTYIERCGGGFPETAIFEFNEDDTLTVLTGTQHNGQGHETSFKQIISQRLGIDVEQIHIVQGDTDRTPKGMTGGSRSVPVGGVAMLGAADKVEAKGRQIAAQALEAAVEDMEFADGVFTVAGTDRRMDLWQVARAARDPANLPDGMEPGLDDDFTQTPEANTFPNGCHIAEVEIDPETGVPEIAAYVIVDDFGDIINPLLLAGQVHGGVAQGIGQALHEHTVYDDSGQLLSGSFMDYAMPRADQLLSFDFTTHNFPCTTNRLGIKGSGEAGAIGAPPALIAAIVDALYAVTGKAHIDMPATPLRIWQELQAAKAG